GSIYTTTSSSPNWTGAGNGRVSRGIPGEACTRRRKNGKYTDLGPPADTEGERASVKQAKALAGPVTSCSHRGPGSSRVLSFPPRCLRVRARASASAYAFPCEEWGCLLLL